MTSSQRQTLNRWLPAIAQIASMIFVIGLAWGSLRGDMKYLKEQNKALWNEVYYLRQRIDESP